MSDMPDRIRCYWADEAKTIVDVARGVHHDTDQEYVHARLLAEKEAEVDHAAEVLRLVGEWVEACDRYEGVTRATLLETPKERIAEQRTRLALLAAARKMKEQP